jgi:hypothetical protein
VASRSTIKGWIRNLLGTTADDPFFADETLDPIVQQAADAIVGAILEHNPDFLVKTPVTLAALAATSNIYNLPSQTTPVTDFAGVLEMRATDETGRELQEARLAELTAFGGYWYAITGADESAQIVTSRDTPAGTPLWLRYRYWPVDMAEDTDAPGGIPVKFHDVVALESLFAYGLGGEQRLPPELFQRWQDRRGQLLSHVSRRSTRPRTTRLLQPNAEL